MEKIVSKRIRMISRWCGRSHQRHKYNQVCAQTRHTKQTNERRDIRKIRMHDPPREKRNTSNAVRGGRQQNQLPRRSGHTYSRNAGRKTTFQQRHINTTRTLHDNGHREFLPDDPSQTPRICQNQTE